MQSVSSVQNSFVSTGIYTFEENPDTFIFVPSPQVKEEYWQQFVP